jgi:hypothetical protein
MKNYTKIIALVAAGIGCSALTSQAALVNVGQGTANTIAASPVTGGGSIIPSGVAEATLPETYNNGLDAGSFTTAVYQGNSFGASDLTFVYTISVTTGDIGSVTVNGFSGTVGLGTSSAGGYQYDPSGFIKLTWTTQSAPSTLTIVVATALTNYALSAGSVQDGLTSNVATYAPAPVPEPTTVAAGALMLLPFGIGALRSLRKDRVS